MSQSVWIGFSLRVLILPTSIMIWDNFDFHSYMPGSLYITFNLQARIPVNSLKEALQSM